MKEQKKGSFNLALLLGALGVVFGDIGTSPLYAVRESLHAIHSGVTVAAIFGIMSLITWSLIVVISLKYLAFVMKADNEGEGGILALLALASPRQIYRSGAVIRFVVPIGVFGAALLYGDGIITPAISVLSAIEGLKVATPLFSPYVIPLTLAVLTVLFFVQSQGTKRIGSVFGPVMVIWFTVIGILGLFSIIETPEILAAVNPYYAYAFIAESPGVAFVVVGSVFLVVTGGEALYADMGHFGRAPIRQAWFLMVLPGLLLNYFGQGALLLRNPEAIENPFYKLCPPDLLIPLVILSTFATVIASQALISGAFSLTRQAMQLGYLPRIQIVHTSKDEIGQIYIPFINWTLYILVVFLVVGFQTSSNMAAAYGIAVTGTMVITTILAYFVVRKRWGWSRGLALLVVIPLIIVDLTFFSSNLLKVSEGGWFPLLIGLIFYIFMSTWRRGRHLLAQRMRELSQPIDEFIQYAEREKPQRVPGTALFMTSDPEGAPPALVHNLRHNRILHKDIVLVTIQTKDVPNIHPNERVRVDQLSDNLYRIVAYYGFMEAPTIHEILRGATSKGYDFPIEQITFFLGRETILPSARPGMAIWRESIFAFMSRNAERATAFFKIPPNQVIEVGLQIEI